MRALHYFIFETIYGSSSGKRQRTKQKVLGRKKSKHPEVDEADEGKVAVVLVEAVESTNN